MRRKGQKCTLGSKVKKKKDLIIDAEYIFMYNEEKVHLIFIFF